MYCFQAAGAAAHSLIPGESFYGFVAALPG
jgi:hypothetical protein